MVSSDAKLIARARTGDLKAVAELWKLYLPRGLRIACVDMPMAEAQDIAADAFDRVILTMAAGKGPTESFKAYYYTTVRNLVANRHRERQRVMIDRLLEEQVDVVEHLRERSAEDVTIDSVERQRLQAALGTLPKRWQLVLWLIEVEGLKPREIARSMGLNAHAVSSLANRARKGLRVAWEELDAFDGAGPTQPGSRRRRPTETDMMHRLRHEHP